MRLEMSRNLLDTVTSTALFVVSVSTFAFKFQRFQRRDWLTSLNSYIKTLDIYFRTSPISDNECNTINIDEDKSILDSLALQEYPGFSMYLLNETDLLLKVILASIKRQQRSFRARIVERLQLDTVLNQLDDSSLSVSSTDSNRSPRRSSHKSFPSNAKLSVPSGGNAIGQNTRFAEDLSSSSGAHLSSPHGVYAYNRSTRSASSSTDVTSTSPFTSVSPHPSLSKLQPDPSSNASRVFREDMFVIIVTDKSNSNIVGMLTDVADTLGIALCYTDSLRCIRETVDAQLARHRIPIALLVWEDLQGVGEEDLFGISAFVHEEYDLWLHVHSHNPSELVTAELNSFSMKSKSRKNSMCSLFVNGNKNNGGIGVMPYFTG